MKNPIDLKSVLIGALSALLIGALMGQSSNRPEPSTANNTVAVNFMPGGPGAAILCYNGRVYGSYGFASDLGTKWHDITPDAKSTVQATKAQP